MGNAMVVYKALGLLMTYPTQELTSASGELRAIFEGAEAMADDVRQGLGELVSMLESEPLLDLQERYVNLFDRTQALSLHLFEHVHGTSRERGQAMVDLQTMYSQHGLEPSTSELPDYLPMLCEFLSLLPEDGARMMLGDLAVILGLLRYRLEARKTPYAAVPAALLDLAQATVDEAELTAALGDEQPVPAGMDELDRQWAEAEVTFGVGAAHSDDDAGLRNGCGGNGADELIQLRRPHGVVGKA